jgi:hypothetical protein
MRRNYSWMILLAATASGLSFTSYLKMGWPWPCLWLGSTGLIPIIHASLTSHNQSIAYSFARYVTYSVLGGALYLGGVFLGWNEQGQALMHLFCVNSATVYSGLLCDLLLPRETGKKLAGKLVFAKDSGTHMKTQSGT